MAYRNGMENYCTEVVKFLYKYHNHLKLSNNCLTIRNKLFKYESKIMRAMLLSTSATRLQDFEYRARTLVQKW